jgi:hypothetical protein
VTLVVSLFANHRGETGKIDEAASALVAGWRAVIGEARTVSRGVRATDTSPILAHARRRLADDRAAAASRR